MTGNAKDEPDGHKGGEAQEALHSIVDFVVERKALTHESGARARPTKPPEDLQPRDLHVCMGLNSCRNQDITRSAPMAGMGQCATVLHVCHGEGACRGRGGCGYHGSDFEQAHPGEQACRWNGSCASPINESRVFAAGPYKGKSVWMTARKLFEARMYEAGVAFGPSPGQGYPDNVVPEYDR